MSTQDLSSHGLANTKLFAPALPPVLLPRPRIIRKLNEALSHKLTLLSAPAGSGKTTLLRQWASQAIQPVAWLSLAETDNDLVRFWTYVVAACQTVQVMVGKLAMAQLQSLESPPLEALLLTLINDLASVSQPFTLILDDYHCITESAIHHTLRMFLDQQPHSLHLVLSSRTDPPLALARRRARGELVELRANDVRFTLEEVTEWFTQLLHLPLSTAQIASLQARTEGWAAALHLATLSLQGSADLSQALVDFTGSHRYVMDYLVEEVLTHQTEEVRSFLLCTAFLDRFTGALCNAVTGRSDGQDILEVLERANLFLLPLDGQRGWYRYHQLFAEVLRVWAVRELGNEQRVALFRRASVWYEGQGLLLEAVETALSASDYDTAVRIGTTIAPQLMLSGQHATVARWIQQLPHSLLFSQPLLCMALAWTLLLSGQRKTVEEPLRKAEQLFRRGKNRQGLGRVAALRALLARLERDGKAAIQWGEQALSFLSEDIQIQRSVSAMVLSYGYRLQGEVSLSRQALVEARLLNEQVNSTSSMLDSLLLQGELLALEGHLMQAANYYRQVIEAQQAWSPSIIEAHLALGALLLEWNELGSAGAQLEQAQVLSHQWEQTSLVAQAALLQARVLQASKSDDQTEEAFLRAVVLARQSKLAQLLARAQAYQIRWWLIQGNLEEVQELQVTFDLNREDAVAYEHEEVALTWMRVLLARGEAATVRRLLPRWQALARTQGRVGSLIEILLLDARATDAQGQISDALLLLQQSILLAERGQYCRLFVDEGPSLTRLLHLLQERWQGKARVAYLEHVLQAMPINQPKPSFSSTPEKRMLLPSPLTPREYKVLRLLAAGLSTREIASELVVSLNTIKTQMQSLYRKLNAKSREEALALARAFQLL